MEMQERNEKDSVILIYHMLAVHHSLRIIQDGSGADRLVQNAILGKNVDKMKIPSKVDHCQKKRLFFGC